MADFKAKGIKAQYAIADAYDTLQLQNAVIKLTAAPRNEDVPLYNAAAMKYKNSIDENTEDLVHDFKISVANAFHCVKTPHKQLKETNGTELFTGGGLALQPNVQVGSLSLGKVALRNLTFQLHEVLKQDNIYVGILTSYNSIPAKSNMHSPKNLGR